jgi:hypothetical protein
MFFFQHLHPKNDEESKQVTYQHVVLLIQEGQEAFEATAQ